MSFLGSPDLFVCNAGNNTLTTYAPGNTTPIATTTSGLDDPDAAIAGTNPLNSYVANAGNNTVTRFSRCSAQ